MLKYLFAAIGFATCVLFAAWIFVLAISYPPLPSGGPKTEGNNYGPHTEYQPSANDQRNASPIPPAIKLIPGDKSDYQAWRDKEESLKKSANERGLTIATWVIGFATIFLVIATAILGIGTFIAAIAAKQAAEHIPIVERAYLFLRITGDTTNHIFKSYEFYDPDKNSSESIDAGMIIDFCFENQGKTPAIIKDISAVVEHWTELPAIPFYGPHLELLPRNRYVKAGGMSEGKMGHMNRSLTYGETASLMKNESYLWFFGRVTYDDIFGRQHEHQFIWRFSNGYFIPYYGNPEYIKNT